MVQGQSPKTISMIKWIRTGRLSIKNSLSGLPEFELPVVPENPGGISQGGPSQARGVPGSRKAPPPPWTSIDRFAAGSEGGGRFFVSEVFMKRHMQ